MHSKQDYSRLTPISTHLTLLLLLWGALQAGAQRVHLISSTNLIASPPFAACHAATMEALPDGLLHVLYTMNRKNIQHVVLVLNT